jgi:hypothetical protein
MELIEAYNYLPPDKETAKQNKKQHSPSNPYWVTKEGVKLYPYQMRDSHIVNVIHYLEQKYGEDMRLLVVKYLLKQPLRKNEKLQIELIEENLLIYIKLIEEALNRGLFKGIKFSFETWSWEIEDVSLS